MAKIHIIGNKAPANAVIARAAEDMAELGYDRVLIVMGGPGDTDIRWSGMTSAQLAFLVAAAQAEMIRLINGCDHG